LTRIRLTASSTGIVVEVDAPVDRPATLRLRERAEEALASCGQPLVEILTAGTGLEWAGARYVDTEIGQRLRYAEHAVERDGAWQTLSLAQRDEPTGLRVTSVLQVHDDCMAVRSATRVRNDGASPVTLRAVSSLVFGDFGITSPELIDGFFLIRGRNDWLAEARWEAQPLRAAGLPALRSPGQPFRSRGSIESTSASSWPTMRELPAAVLYSDAQARAWSFQVEHNGAWTWQMGEVASGLYVALFGPTDERHQWECVLAPGEEFETVPAALALESVGNQSHIGSLTNFRRRERRRQPVGEPPVVFNDYMNTVMGNPTAETLYPLIDAAAAIGAEYFVVDAGWYAEGGDWWDCVGEWVPSQRRFPDGLGVVFDRIRAHGMAPGLWLEPEVIGVSSPVADKLPTDAFLQRGGARHVEHGRFHLDFSHAATTAFMDEVVDRLVTDVGAGYFKFDYNIRAGVGTDVGGVSAGHGLLLHNRAYLSWVDAVRRRHPDVLLENCASGGMRQDFATLSLFDLQSTSDQEDFRAYPPIAAGTPMLVLPEQAGNWACPQPSMSDSDLVFTLCNAFLGRLYLSGWIDKLSAHQRHIVVEAVTAYKEMRHRLSRSAPFWPLGLPGWADEWVAFGLRDDMPGSDGMLHLSIWHRGDAPAECRIPLPTPPPGSQWQDVAPVFPRSSPMHVELVGAADAIRAVDPQGSYLARVVSLKPTPSG
jgi:alpha-galactosidase